MQVAVIDQNRKPLAPTSEIRARLLLKKGKAAVFRQAPFTLILKRVVRRCKCRSFGSSWIPGRGGPEWR